MASVGCYLVADFVLEAGKGAEARLEADAWRGAVDSVFPPCHCDYLVPPNVRMLALAEVALEAFDNFAPRLC